MKKILCIFLIFTVIFAFSACGSENDDVIDDPKPDIEPTVSDIILESDMHAETFREGEDELAAYAYCVPKLVSGEDKAHICDTFNSFFAQFVDSAVSDFNAGTYSTAKNEYQSMEEGEVWGDRLYFSEITYNVTQSGNYIGVGLDKSESVGMLRQYVGYSAVMFDKQIGKFITLSNMTDDYAAMQDGLYSILIAQMAEQGMTGLCYEGYEQKVRELTGAEIYFSEDGAIIVFPVGTLADCDLILLVDFQSVSPFFNAYASELLNGLIK